jgi:hypothetical protein
LATNLTETMLMIRTAKSTQRHSRKAFSVPMVSMLSIADTTSTMAKPARRMVTAGSGDQSALAPHHRSNPNNTHGSERNTRAP